MTEQQTEMFREITKAIEDEHFDANEWETEFMEKIGGMLSRGFMLTEKQDAALERLWRKATGK